MKRIARILFVFIFIAGSVLLLSLVSEANSLYAVTVPKYENIIIDGFRDNGYKTVFSYSPTGGYSKYYLFNPENSAQIVNVEFSVSSCWDDDFLYLYIEISGLERNIENPGANKIGDCILLGTKTSDGKNIIYSLSVYNSLLQLSCVDNSGFGFSGMTNCYTSFRLPEAFVKNSDGKCIYEIAFEWKALGITLSEDTFFPFNIAAGFNKTPYRVENAVGMELSAGFIESVIYQKIVPEFSSELRLGKLTNHIHIPANPETVINSTCEINGKEITRCSECGKIISERLLPLVAHKAGEQITVNENPVTPGYGYISVSCVWCGRELSRDVIISENKDENSNNNDSDSEDPPKENNCSHSSSMWETILEANCVSEGIKVRKCKSCSEIVENKIIPKTAHGSGSWEIISFPTETVSGEKVKRCKFCGEIMDSKVLPAGSSSVLSGISDDISDFIERYIAAVYKMNGIDSSIYSDNQFSALNNAYVYFTECVDSEAWEMIKSASESFDIAFSELSVIVSEDIEDSFSDISDNVPMTVYDGNVHLISGFLLSAIVLFIIYFAIFKIRKNG